MGLAGAKNRRKLGKDPNNTKWTRNTDSFGHRILRSQGWEPGQFLGAKDAAHAEFHTAANASHIRAFLKEDNLGLGAKLNKGDECTGLDVFKDLLGRLNGKSEVIIEKERKAREDVKMSLYMERKFGRMRFVSGGLLVGDQIQELLAAQEAGTRQAEGRAEASSPEPVDDVQEKPRKEKKSKKRKAESLEPDEGGKKEKKKRKGTKAALNTQTDPAIESHGVDGSPRTNVADTPGSSAERAMDSKSKKKSKRRAEAESQDAAPEVHERQSKTRERQKVDEESTPSSEAEFSAVSGRHFARKRFITQKRAALLDAKALKQIFMIKTEN